MKIYPLYFLFILLFITIYLIYCIPFYAHAESLQNAPGSSITTPQELWLNSLSQCESGGKSEITILDTNNKYSYGEYQFQFLTWMGFGKQYGILPQELTDKEGLLLIHNSFVQRGIARKMLDDGLSFHWKNCRDKIGVYPLTGD